MRYNNTSAYSGSSQNSLRLKNNSSSVRQRNNNTLMTPLSNRMIKQSKIAQLEINWFKK